MLKLFTVSAALAAALITTAINPSIASLVEPSNQLVEIPHSLSEPNPPATADNNSHTISALIAASIVLLLIKNQSSKAGARGKQVKHFGGFSGRSKRKQHLESKLLNRLDSDVADRLIDSAKRSNPGKSEQWYIEKVAYDLNRDRR